MLHFHQAMKAILRLLAVFVLFGVAAHAQTTIYWNFSTGTGSPNSLSANLSGAVIAGQNVDPLYTPAFDTVNPSGGYSGASGIHNASIEVNSVAGPVTLANLGTATYFEFTVAPDPGYSLQATDFQLGSRSKLATGPTTLTLVASTDGFATFSTLGATALAADNNWALVTLSSFSYTAATDVPITFRIYGTDGTGGSVVPNWRIDDVTLGVVAVPEPSTYASLLVGVVLLGARALRRRRSAVA